jgi:hypothetical protein
MPCSGFRVAVALLDLWLPELLFGDVDGSFPSVAPLAGRGLPG